MSCRFDNVTVDWDHPFWSRVWPEALSGCWLWDGPPGTHGYGQAILSRGPEGPLRVTTAPRAAMVNVIGRRLRTDEVVCHRCDNKMCVNPDHLYVGTHLTNAKDARQRGRVPSGVGQPRPRIPSRVRRAICESDDTLSEIARKVGCHKRTVARIRAKSRSVTTDD